MAESGPLKFAGGKGYLSGRIIELMAPHITYLEPFFGGGSVLFARDPNDPRLWLPPHEGVSEVVNDINSELTNFWMALADVDAFARMERFFQAVPFAQSIWEHSRQTPLKLQDPDWRCAAQFFIRCRQSMSGMMKSFAPITRKRLRRGMNEQASAWLSAIEGLPQAHERLKRVVILNDDALKVIQAQDDPATLMYLDPPYPHETRTATKLYGVHEMTLKQHKELLDTLLQVKAKVILSGYACDLYDKPLHQWTRHTFDLPNNLGSGKTKRRMQEVLWLNY